MTNLSPYVLAVAASLAVTTGVSAADPAGRYTMSPTDSGMLRLDTVTGAVSLCSRRSEQWVCEPVSDETASTRAEIDRLTAENRDLRAEVQRLEEFALSGGGRAPERHAERPGGRLELPSEADVDRAFDYVERMFKKFRNKLKEFDGSDRRGIAL